MSKGNGYGTGTFLDAKMFLSPAFLSLGDKGTAPVVTNCSMKVLILFLGKRQFGTAKHKGQKVKERTDGNRFMLTYKELESHGIDQKRATRAIDELLAKGFISIIDPGGLYEKHKAVYALEEDYRRWRRGDDPVRTRGRDVRRGFQGKKINIADVNGGHPHGRQRGTPGKRTRTSTGDTPKRGKKADAYK